MDLRRSSRSVWLLLTFLAVVAAPVAADDLWVEVTPSGVGSAPLVDVRDQVGGVVIDVDLPGFYVDERTVEGVRYSKLTVPGCGSYGEVGWPNLPFRSVLVPIPNGPAATLRLTESRSSVVLEGVSVLPRQAPMPECGSAEPEFVIDDKAYGTDAWLPATPARIADDVVVRGQRFLVVELSPLAVNPARHQVTAQSHLSVAIDLAGEVDAAAEARKAERVSPLFPTLAVVDGAAPADANPTGIEYLIVAYDPLIPSLEPLAEWKRLKGLTVEIVAMSTIGTTAAELKAFLQARYDSDPDLTYVLLAGDHPMVPSEDVSSGMVSDLYLSCLDGSDYFPDVVMGRIAVQSPTDCEHVVEKILDIDRDVVPGVWHGDYLMASYFESSSCQSTRWFFETSTHAMHYVRDVIGMGIHTAATSNNLSCNPYVWHVGDYPHRFSGYSGQPVPQADADLITSVSQSTQDVIDGFNAGVSIVQHRDHGGVTLWSSPPFSNSHVATLTNGDMTPVVYSINCDTGTFNSSGDCLAEALMKKYPGGAVGVIAATASSYSGYNDLLVHGSYDCFWDSYDSDDGGNIYPHSFRPAEAYLYGKYYMYNWEGSGSMTQLEFELFHWHGDPEMQAFTAVPVAPSASVDPTIPVGSSSLSVSVNVDGAMVAVTDDGTLLGRAVVAGGVALIALDPVPETPGTLDIVVTGHDLVPWQGTTEVIVPTGPWMAYRSHLCDDSAGDGDGIANPGETIVLPVTVENVGADDGTGIAGVLSSGSASCVVTDVNASFPDAVVGAQVQSLPDHYSVAIDPATPNGHLAALTLDWSASGSYSGATVFTLPVCEHLVISDVTMDFVGDTSAVVSWITNVPASSRVLWGTTSPTTTIDGSGTNTAHSIWIEGLSACTDYVLQVSSTSPNCYTEVDDNGGSYYGFETSGSAPVVADATDTPVSIPDNNPTGASSMITVTSPYDVIDVDLLVNITHTYTGDLSLSLIGPDGTTVLLSGNHGGSGNDYTNTIFDDEAATAIGSGSAPFTGTFQPDQPLAALDGQPAAGVWTFKVVDSAGQDVGTIDDWQLQLTVNEPCDNDAIFADDFETATTNAWGLVVP
jgi:subtilisin-like proprotein convertase family protein